MKMLNIAIALSLTASAYAGDLTTSLSATSESEFLAQANVGWIKTAPAHYEYETPAGERIAVGFGPEAMINDLALLDELADVQLIRLAKAVESRERVRLRDSISQTHKAIASIQQGLDESATTNSETSTGTCKLQARASIIPSCSTAGYRSVSWTTDCKSVQARYLPNPHYGDGKPLLSLPID